MIRPIVVASLFAISATCAAGEPVAQPVHKKPTCAELQKRIDQLERRILELERQSKYRPQIVPPSTRSLNGQVYHVPAPAIPRTPDMTQPSQTPSSQPVQPPRGDVPQNWQEFYFNGQWFYIIPIDARNGLRGPERR
ncbi:hypothetical protein [Crateriforma spongiae]|uniref:hypothetical protein n=1 Tax=Crateriforma spongiae TaxID=2724528 RepID=UPI0039AF130D